VPPDLRDEIELRGMLHLEEASLPETIAQHVGVDRIRTLRASGFCVLRKRLADLCEARICLRGKLENFEGFWPSILAIDGTEWVWPSFLNLIQRKNIASWLLTWISIRGAICLLKGAFRRKNNRR
jgi:hypothetical protein